MGKLIHTLHRERGITLLELTIALAVMGVVSAPLAGLTFEFVVRPSSTLGRLSGSADIRLVSDIIADDARSSQSFVVVGVDPVYGSFEAVDLTRDPPQSRSITYLFNAEERAMARQTSLNGVLQEETLVMRNIASFDNVRFTFEEGDLNITLDEVVPEGLEGILSTVGSSIGGNASVADPAAVAGGFAIFATRSVRIPGGAIAIIGNIHSNGSVDLSGSGDLIQGNVTGVTGVSIGGSGNFADSINGAAASRPEPFALTVGAFKPFTFDFTGQGPLDLKDRDEVWLDPFVKTVLKPGVYFSDSTIQVSGADVRGTVTIIAPTVLFSGSDQRFESFRCGILAFAPLDPTNSNLIHLSGSGRLWTGALYASEGTIHIAGSSFLGDGNLLAGEVIISGSSSQLAFSREVIRAILGKQ